MMDYSVCKSNFLIIAGSPSITSLLFDRDNTTFRCSSTGGPPTTVIWRKNGVLVNDSLYQQSQRVADTETATYESILFNEDITNLVGTFTCEVSNIRSTVQENVEFHGNSIRCLKLRLQSRFFWLIDKCFCCLSNIIIIELCPTSPDLFPTRDWIWTQDYCAIYGCMYDQSFLHSGVHLSLKGVVYLNNSFISITEIGQTDTSASPPTINGLQCVTDKRPCCSTRPNRFGEWLFPDGSIIPILGGATTFYRNRGDDGTVNLNRVNSDVMMPTGQFCCVVPDPTDFDQTLCVNTGQLCKGGSS